MQNFGERGNEVTNVVKGESVWWTKSSRSLNTHPLRAFIIKSICSFIICISATIWGGTASTANEWLVFSCYRLLRVLLPSGTSWSLLSALVPSWSSPWVLSIAFFWCNYSFRLWFCLVRCSTAAARAWTCLLRVVVRGSSLWALLVVAI